MAAMGFLFKFILFVYSQLNSEIKQKCVGEEERVNLLRCRVRVAVVVNSASVCLALYTPHPSHLPSHA